MTVMTNDNINMYHINSIHNGVVFDMETITFYMLHPLNFEKLVECIWANVSCQFLKLLRRY